MSFFRVVPGKYNGETMTMRMKGIMFVVLAVGLSVLIAASTAPADLNEKELQAALAKYFETTEGQEAAGKAVEQYFQRKQQEAQKQQEHQAEAQIEEQFKNPVELPVGNSPASGPANAKVTIFEFSDFQCPYCKRGADVMDEVKKNYPNDVRVVWKNLPLAFHKQAKPAAKAALAAGKQGKFWEMHDALFNNQQKLGDSLYAELAKELGLDVDKFNKDMKSAELEKSIEEDMALAEKHGIRGTPGFFVNGVAVRGAYPFEHFKKIIDRWMEKK